MSSRKKAVAAQELAGAWFARMLRAWGEKSGRKGLPWQVKDPYKVWISEIMLQQTQVAAVIPYFKRFLEAFPTVEALSQAKEEQVLLLWEGLGYYARARNLLASAKKICVSGKALWPVGSEEWEALPGIGKSTAAAICSICWDWPCAIADGNAQRVLSRFWGMRESINVSAGKKEIWRLAAISAPEKGTGAHTQAIMDLGATVCLPKKALCGQCPMQTRCAAFLEGKPESYPRKKKKDSAKKDSAKRNARQEHWLMAKDEKGRLAMEEGGRGVWKGLWSLPSVSRKFLVAWGAKEKGSAKAVFSHYTIEAKIWAVLAARKTWPKGWRALNRKRMALPSPVSRALENA